MLFIIATHTQWKVSERSEKAASAAAAPAPASAAAAEAEKAAAPAIEVEVLSRKQGLLHDRSLVLLPINENVVRSCSECLCNTVSSSCRNFRLSRLALAAAAAQERALVEPEELETAQH